MVGMDRRSWLWRRKSSEKSPAETDSSGSISSLSERFSDDQAYPVHNFQSLEVTSKDARIDEEVKDNVKALTEKLSTALSNISAKEELVKQHAKVAEEAVSGWEKAEREVYALKQQLEASTKKNSDLEDRVGHLDEALRECMRQLRQTREEQDRRFSEAFARKTHEWETMKSEFESQLVELEAQLQTAKNEAAISVDSDFQKKLEAVEKENSHLRLEILSQAEELEIRIMERDLSTKAAETASKQHLESIKKAAKIEAECRKLKAMVRKASLVNDHKSLTASSVYVESYMDSQSDIGEMLLVVENDACKVSSFEMNECAPSCSESWASALRTDHNQVKNPKAVGRNLMVPSVEIDLMDDFLEMERLAALPDTESRGSYPEAGPISDQSNGGEMRWKTELEALIHRTADLEEKLENMEEEKVKFETALLDCQRQLEISKSELKEANTKLEELQTQLAFANELKQAREEEIKGIKTKTIAAESKLRIAEAEMKTLISKVNSLDTEIEKERALSAENLAKCLKLEDKLFKVKCDAKLQHEAELRRVSSFNGELKAKQEKELAVAASKFAECQKTIASLDRQLKSLATLEDLMLDSEKFPDLPHFELLQYPSNGGGSMISLSDDL